MNTKDRVLIALFAAITAVLGVFPPIALPMTTVPITAQLMGPMLAGAVLGARRAGFSLLVFCLLAGVGLPVMAGGKGGFGVFLGVSGGFVLAWPFAAYSIGAGFERLKNPSWIQEFIILSAGGILLVYAIGVPWMAKIMGVGLREAMLIALIFIPGDLLKVLIVLHISRAIRRVYPLETKE